jgi:hypothetical protein
MSPFSTRSALGALGIAAWAAVPLAWAATPRAEIEATYQQDRAACLDGQSQHERSSCLREAGAVRAEARSGQRAPATSAAALARNALQRCKDLPRENQVICERMVGGEGRASGSVAGGGVIRELETELPAAPRPEPVAAPDVVIIVPAPAR